jgi:hypothetical protein
MLQAAGPAAAAAAVVIVGGAVVLSSRGLLRKICGHRHVKQASQAAHTSQAGTAVAEEEPGVLPVLPAAVRCTQALTLAIPESPDTATQGFTASTPGSR